MQIRHFTLLKSVMRTFGFNDNCTRNSTYRPNNDLSQTDTSQSNLCEKLHSDENIRLACTDIDTIDTLMPIVMGYKLAALVTPQ